VKGGVYIAGRESLAAMGIAEEGNFVYDHDCTEYLNPRFGYDKCMICGKEFFHREEKK
jgi:hypothetical protein